MGSSRARAGRAALVLWILGRRGGLRGAGGLLNTCMGVLAKARPLRRSAARTSWGDSSHLRGPVISREDAAESTKPGNSSPPRASCVDTAVLKTTLPFLSRSLIHRSDNLRPGIVSLAILRGLSGREQRRNYYGPSPDGVTRKHRLSHCGGSRSRVLSDCSSVRPAKDERFALCRARRCARPRAAPRPARAH